MQFEFIVLYPINPKALARYREALYSSGAKDDPTDADLLLKFFESHRERLRAWVPEDPVTRQLGMLVEFRRKLMRDAVRLGNRLTAVLKGYYPQALELLGDLKTGLACAFLLKWPLLATLKDAKLSELKKFYFDHACRNASLVEERLRLISSAQPLTEDTAIIAASMMMVDSLAKQLQELLRQISHFDIEIGKVFCQHPDQKIYASLPGAGNVLEPRLAAAMGTNRDSINKEIMRLYADRVCAYSFGAEEKRAWIARVKIFFRWLTDCGLILSDPTAAIPLPAAKKRKYPLTCGTIEIAKLLNAVPFVTPTGLRDRVILELLYSCGLRSGEIIRLQLADINFADGVVRIVMSKGKKDRMVTIGAVALSWLDRYIKEVHGLHLSSPLFYHFADRSPLAYYNLRQIIAKYKALAGLNKRCHPRSFRHSFAIHLLENGAGIRHIQAMMGHASLKTTQKYTRIVPEELKRAHARAHPSEKRQGRLELPKADPVQFRRSQK